METMYDVPISRVNVEVNYIHVVHREKSVMVFKQIEIEQISAEIVVAV